jgi:four helix bundle protein
VAKLAESLVFCDGTERALLVAMNQWREEMKERTRAFAVAVVSFVQTIPEHSGTRRVKDQLIGAAWGVDGNWRAACLARSHKEFAATLGTVVVEADEAEEALIVIAKSKLSTASELPRLLDESTQLCKIFKKAARTASDNERVDKEEQQRARRARKRRRRD